uniref:Death domain-containing protein n=1 Tax=Amphimedon queenslandica TaxID=400682 RepID=A0A1X7UVJ5_AMPQE
MTQIFENVCSKVLCIGDLNVVYDKVKPIASRWKHFANSLYIRPDTIDIIETDCGSSCESCLRKVLDYWRVCVAVKGGGGDTALAEEIAREHPQSASIGGESTTDASIYAFPVRDVRLLDEIYELQLEFSDILKETRDAFKPELFPDIIDYLETHVAALLGPNKNNQTEEITEEFNNIQTIKDLFKILQRKYISWFNYELIVKLVNVFLPNNRSLKRTWSDYKEKLKDYFLNSGGLLTDANALEFGIKDVPPGTRVMIAKVDRDDYTPADLFFFRRAIPKELNIPNVNLYFSFVRIGSLQLLYNIPDYLYSALFPLSTEIQEQLASIAITELTCGDYKYDLRKFSASQELQQSPLDIDICDRLWYENTSTPLHEAAWRGLKDEVQWLLSKFGYSTYRGLHGWTPLHSASYSGHIEILQLLIHQYGIDPNEGDDNSVSSIHMASYKGHLSIVQYLVDTCDVPPDQPDNSNNTPLLYSAMGGHSDLVEFFIEKNCNISQINSHNASLSLLACKSGQVALIDKLEAVDLFKPNSSDCYGFGILHYSSMSNNVELFKYLLNRYQLSIDVKDRYGKTPLHIASWYASSSVVEYIVSIQGNEALLVNDNNCNSCLHFASLASIAIKATTMYSKLIALCDASNIEIVSGNKIKNNINFIIRNKRIKVFTSLLKKAINCHFDINATTTNGESLLHYASRSGSTLLVKALEEYNINCTLDNDGMSPVHYAAWSGSTSVLSYIISQYNLSANDTDTYGHTSLVYSCQSGSINSVKYLINNHNSDPNIIDNDGMTCLHHSCRHGHIDITHYLIEVQHCDINETDNEGRTLVHHAAQSGNFDLVQYLITEQGLSPTAVDKNGLTALHYTSVSLNLSLVKELITTYQLDPHQVDSNGKLPIHYAAESGNILLLELYAKDHKCSLSLTDNKNWNIFHFSSLQGHTHFIKHITSLYPQYISLLHSTDNEGSLALHLACQSGSNQLVTFLIDDMKCNFTATDTLYGSNCVMYACVSGNLDLVQLLIQQYKLEPVNINNTGFSVLHAAAQEGHTHILEWYSQEYSVDITNHTDNNKYTLAHLAAHNGKLHCLQELINKYQCDVNATTTDTGNTVLHKACQGGHVPVVLYLTSLPQCNVAAKTSNGSTALHITCQYSNSLPILKHLVENHQLDLCAVNDEGMAPIHLACLKGRLNLVQYIRNHLTLQSETGLIEDILKQHTTKSGSLALHLACESGNIQLVTFLIDDMKCDVTATDTLYGSSCVMDACSSGNLDLVQLLIQQYKLEPININNTGFSVLHAAAQEGHTHILEWYSQEYSVDITNHTDNNKYTLAHLAASNGKLHCLQELINKYQCDINATTTDTGNTVLHKACQGGHVPVVLYLTSLPQCNVAAKTSNGSTALHITCQYSNSLPILKHLVENHQLDLCAVNDEGMAPIHLACLKGRLNLVKYVINHLTLKSKTGLIEDILKQCKTESGSTALHLACESGNIQLVTYLIDDMKCDVTATDTGGSNCVMDACLSGNLNLVQLLIQQYKLEPININNTGFSVLHAAAQEAHTHILEWYSQEYSVDITNHTDNNKYTLAHLAAYNGKLHCLQELINNQEYSVDITNHTENNKYTLAHSAAYNGKLHCLQELINKYQCDVNATTTDTGSTVFHEACEGGHVPVVLYLTSLPQCNIAAKTSNGSTALHITCEYSDSLPILKHLVENHELDLCAVNDEGMAPIHLACSEGRLNFAQYIIKHIPSSLELPTRGQGHTPFLAAVYFNQLEVIKYLISKKCNLSATDDEGSGAVHISVERGHLNILKYLIDNYYCNPNATNHQDRTPLHLAVAVDQLDVLEYLLSKSIPSMSVVWLREIKCLLDSPHDIYNNPHNAVLINVQDKDGNTPLHLACQDGQQNMASLLQEASLSNNNLLITNKKGQTPIHLAVASGHKDTAEVLLSSVTGSSTHHDLLTATDNEGSTVLHTACSNGHIDVFRYLSSIYPQGVNAMDNRGRGLLHAACEGGDIEIVKELIEKYKQDPLLEDDDGITCLHLLTEMKKFESFLLRMIMDIAVRAKIAVYQYLEPNIVSNPVPKDKSGRTPLHYASRSDNTHMARYLIETFPCTPDDPDNNGYTSVHGACEGGSMELVQYFLTELQCNVLAETEDMKTLLYFASMSFNLELVRFLVERYNLKPRQHDIDVAQATSPGSSIVRYLEKVHHDMILDVVEEQRRKVSKRTTTGAGIEEPHSTKRIKGTALGIIVVGLSFVFMFHVGTKEPSNGGHGSAAGDQLTNNRLPWYRWFLNPKFYLVALIYMSSRLIVNLTQVYSPLYMIDSLKMYRSSVAIIPLVIYFSGLIATFFMKRLNEFVGRYVSVNDYYLGFPL